MKVLCWTRTCSQPLSTSITKCHDFLSRFKGSSQLFEPKGSRAACVPIPSLTENPEHVLHSLGIAAGGGGSLAGLVPTRIHFPGSAAVSCHLSAGETFGYQLFRVRSPDRVRAPRHEPARELYSAAFTPRAEWRT